MSDGPLRAVEEHIRAFNAADLDAVMAGFDDEAVFSTADQLVVGARAIGRLFADSFAAPATARLELQRVVVDGDTAGCELVEYITADGVEHTLDVAAFYTVRDGCIARVRIYRDIAA
ncbi:MAG TPA: nuclear transport factor 2 family protein [Euzebyales bacterium]|nr:nuclear transport factor 2 family protein [Euzebyales bacterium]